MEILAIEGLTKNFYLHNLGKTIKSCRDIGFTLHEGEFIGIVGRSGAGKSSILKCINRTYLRCRVRSFITVRLLGLLIWLRPTSGICCSCAAMKSVMWLSF
mgnify:CR=1 FL=1